MSDSKVGDLVMTKNSLAGWDSSELIAVSELIPSASNARTHSKRQVAQIAASIAKFGWTNPILIDENNMVMAGHGRLRAAQLNGMTQVPFKRLSQLTEQDKRAYMLADNQLALKAGWDKEILAIELGQLTAAEFDITSLGFEIGEVDIIIGEASKAAPDSRVDNDDVVPPLEEQVVTKSGDVWCLGRHRLMCGNARDRNDVELLMGHDQADLIFTDPPYNVKIQGHVSGLGKVQHREFAEASGEMSAEQFTEFLSETLRNGAAVCREGAIAYVCMDWRHQRELLDAATPIFSELKNMCVWVKTNAGMGTFYRSQHELVFVWKVGSASHLNNFGLGDTGRYRTNVWTYAGVNSFGKDRTGELASHPTVKPVAMVADAILDVSKRVGIVLDLFGGSGTTLIAAERTGRRARILEIDPQYCDVTIRRWQSATGKEAALLSSGNSFEQTRIMRTGWTSNHTVKELVE